LVQKFHLLAKAVFNKYINYKGQIVNKKDKKNIFFQTKLDLRPRLRLHIIKVFEANK
jgi:hypothetical protein